MSFTGTAASMKQASPKQEDKPRVYVLNTTHRCDSCSAQAYVQVTLTTSQLELLFCKHHYNRNEIALLAIQDMDKLIDESDRLRDVNRLVGTENN